ncbi:MAG: GNAT family N-acetyltransferase [Fimbriimonadaceae bacterium]
MTSAQGLDGPTLNLVETYFRLAQATPGACIWSRGNLRGCTGAFGHPICNFAIASELADTDFLELERVVRGRDPFHVYLLPGSAAAPNESRLASMGLQPAYRLVQMLAQPTHDLSEIQPVEATTHAARFALAKFMVNQFFMAQPRRHREGIARATASAGGLDLYAVGCQGAVIASLMLCREGATLGVYNLCVAPESRNQGWGRRIVGWARSVAGSEGRTLTLQCDARLAQWYRDAGFDEIGEITAFTRVTGGAFDTM